MRSASRPLRSVILRAPTLRASPRDTIDLITAPLETKMHGCSGQPCMLQTAHGM